LISFISIAISFSADIRAFIDSRFAASFFARLFTPVLLTLPFDIIFAIDFILHSAFRFGFLRRFSYFRH